MQESDEPNRNMLGSELNAGITTKRNSIDTDELVKRIHASKPKSVFLDSKPTVTGHKYAFGKSSKIAATDQALQSVKRAAFATETSDEVYILLMGILELWVFVWWKAQ